MRYLKHALFAAALLAFAVPAVSYAQPHHHPGHVQNMRVDVHSAKAHIKNEPFADGKRVIIDSLVSTGNQFMCSDVVEILDAFDFDDEKVDAAIKMYPNTIDKNNWYTVYASFDFDSSKQKVRQAVAAMPQRAPVAPPAPPVPQFYAGKPIPPQPHVAPPAAHPHPVAPPPAVRPMPPQHHHAPAPAPVHRKPMININSFLSALENEPFSDGKRSVISSAAATNSFTSADVAAIIRVMKFSDEQVYAATTLYDSVVDKNNWYIIYDAVTFSSDKDKIRNRVGH